VENATSTPELLVVDDDEGLRLLMTDSLRAEGYAVETAADARETLARLDRRPPDLLVLDLKLPDGGGPELIARLQRDRPAVPFVVVTGRGDEKAARIAEEHRAYAAGKDLQ
jgi:two-component system OmpR family response regulator